MSPLLILVWIDSSLMVVQYNKTATFVFVSPSLIKQTVIIISPLSASVFFSFCSVIWRGGGPQRSWFPGCKKHCNQGKGTRSKQKMEGAHHCYETEMTSNYLLAANVRVYQLLHRRPLFPSSLSFCCFSAEEPFRQVSNASLFFFSLA